MSASSATEDADAARAELAACEKEISTVKALLRSLGSSGGGGGDADDATNRLTVSWIKVRNHRINTCSMNLREREPLGCGRVSYSVPATRFSATPQPVWLSLHALLSMFKR